MWKKKERGGLGGVINISKNFPCSELIRERRNQITTQEEEGKNRRGGGEGDEKKQGYELV